MASTLVEWLMAWHHVIQNSTTTTTTNTRTTHTRHRHHRWWSWSWSWWHHHHHQHEEDPPRPDVGIRVGTQDLFACYDPRNQQTVYTEFALDYRQHHRTVDDFGLDRVAAKNDLEARFEFVGITDRMTESNCLLVIYYSGWVPPACDCTVEEEEEDSLPQPQPLMTTTTNTSQWTSSKSNNNNYYYYYNSSSSSGNKTGVSFSHGVQHHGSSYETSPLEDHLLDELTRWDQLLYDVATDLFWQRLIETEYEYGITICEVLRTDVSRTFRSRKSKWI